MNSETKYNKIGDEYNSTRFADEFLTEKIFEFLNSSANEKNLDIGCGTGNYTIALANKGLNFIGVEPSTKMLEIAKSKSEKIDWKIGSAENIPAENESIENVIATLTIHHWTDLNKAMKEIYRILKPKGKLIIFTSTPNQMENYWLNNYFPKMMEKSIQQMPSIQKIETELVNTGFQITETEKYFVTYQLQDFFLYSGKERPEIYLQEKFRKGISSFASLSNKDEVLKGVEMLRQDLTNGNFNKIKNKFEENCGDYIFIVAKKDFA